MSEESNEQNLEISNELEFEEQKTFVNLVCCQLSLGIIFTYTYITASILINLINRIIFLTYKFRFNYFFLFLQQILCLILFNFIGRKNPTFRDFKKICFINDIYN